MKRRDASFSIAPPTVIFTLLMSILLLTIVPIRI
jgi:hypothetical protein